MRAAAAPSQSPERLPCVPRRRLLLEPLLQLLLLLRASLYLSLLPLALSLRTLAPSLLSLVAVTDLAMGLRPLLPLLLLLLSLLALLVMPALAPVLAPVLVRLLVADLMYGLGTVSNATLGPVLPWGLRKAPSLGPNERPRTRAATALAPAPRGAAELAELALLTVDEEGTEEDEEKEEEEVGDLSALAWPLEPFFGPSPFMAPTPCFCCGFWPAFSPGDLLARLPCECCWRVRNRGNRGVGATRARRGPWRRSPCVPAERMRMRVRLHGDRGAGGSTERESR